jgi:hypothetical protein
VRTADGRRWPLSTADCRACHWLPLIASDRLSWPLMASDALFPTRHANRTVLSSALRLAACRLR